MNEEQERGKRDAYTNLIEIDVVRVKRTELRKLCSLVENFLQSNSEGEIEVFEPAVLQRKRLIRNLEDVDYVLGYLKGLT